MKNEVVPEEYTADYAAELAAQPPNGVDVEIRVWDVGEGQAYAGNYTFTEHYLDKTKLNTRIDTIKQAIIFMLSEGGLHPTTSVVNAN